MYTDQDWLDMLSRDGYHDVRVICSNKSLGVVQCHNGDLISLLMKCYRYVNAYSIFRITEHVDQEVK
jgi:hypothetical protein